MRKEAKELERGAVLMWWECDHEAKGVAGCPVCDEKLSDDARHRLKQARAKIFRCQDAIRSLIAEIDGEVFVVLSSVEDEVVQTQEETVKPQIYGDYFGWL